MSIGQSAGVGIGKFEVHTTSNRGHSPEFYADRLTDKLIHVSAEAPQPIRDQAYAYRDSIHAIALMTIQTAIQSDRTTIAAALREVGMDEAAEFVLLK